MQAHLPSSLARRFALLAAALSLTAIGSAGCGGGGGDGDDDDAVADGGGAGGELDAGAAPAADASIPAGPPERVWVVPWEAALCPGQRLQLQASAFYGEDLYDVTHLVTWTTSDDSAVAVDATGEALGVAAGSATITAELLGVSDTADLSTVHDEVAGMIIQPATATIAAGLGQAFQAKSVTTCGFATDVTEAATWGSTVPAVANVSAPGQVETALQGTATITASAGGFQASAPITVTRPLPDSLAVDPAAVALVPSTCGAPPVQLAAYVTFTDGSVQDVTDTATWTSGVPGIVSVTGPGQVIGLTAGGTEIVARYEADGVTVSGLAGATVASGCGP